MYIRYVVSSPIFCQHRLPKFSRKKHVWVNESRFSFLFCAKTEIVLGRDHLLARGNTEKKPFANIMKKHSGKFLSRQKKSQTVF
jgi:hypothetical protein